MLEVKIKKLHKDAVIPKYETVGSAGMDLTAVSKEYDEHGNICYDTGLAFEIPENHVGLIFPRSSLSKKDLMLTNSVGVIDADYRGSISFKFKPTLCYADYTPKSDEDYKENSDYITAPQITDNNIVHEDYSIGDRIGQIVILPYPKVSFVEVEELPETERGSGGFGSTDKISELVEKLILSTTEKFVSEGGSMRGVLKGDMKSKVSSK